MILIKLLLVLAAVIAALAGLSRLFREWYRVPDSHDETHWVTAEDGWRLALHRIRPKDPDPDKRPVLLCHGFGANRFNFDFPERSFARWLAERGYDCYVIELRGTGHSAKRRWFDPKRWDFHFPDFPEKDLPAAIEHVKKVTGRDRIHYVGHSMGGMSVYAYAQRPGADGLASITSVAGPCAFAHLSKMVPLTKLKPLLAPFPAIHTEALFGLFIPLIGRWLPGMIEDNYNPENMTALTLRRAAANLVSPTSRGLLFNFVHFVQTGHFRAPDGWDYAEHFDGIEMPIFFIAGSVDKLCPPDCVESGYEAVSSKDKKYRLFGRSEGDRMDYGHGDIVIGETAADEVYPEILQWIEAHDG